MYGNRVPSTPLPYYELVKNTETATLKEVKEYQEKVGSVLYTAIMLRPDFAFAASQLSQFATNPSPSHIEAINWTIRFLWGSRFRAIVYSRRSPLNELVIASDTSFADDVETRRSSQGYIGLVFGGAFVWKACKQSTVTISTTETELLGVTLTVKEVLGIRQFFGELGLSVGSAPWTIYCDNLQLRQEHQKGSFQVSYLPTSDMPADGLTKNLSRQKFERFVSLL